MDKITFLQFILYAVFMFSIVAYATLDGFDLGVGCLHLFTKGDKERRLMLNAIGPVWDGNTTWIVIGGGVLFAAFPKAFSILAPNFYTPLMGMLFGFMVRAAAIEFRSKKESVSWRSLWDGCFFFASLLLAFLVGMLLGNLIQGLPLDDSGIIVGGTSALLTPYPLLIAFFGMITFAMHGSLYLLMKTEGAFHNKVGKWAKKLINLFLVFWIAASAVTFISQPHMTEPFARYPLLLTFPFLSFISILGILYAIKQGLDGLAFTLSCSSIFFLLSLFVIGTFPHIAYSTINPEKNGLTFMNSSVSELALTVLALVALSGLPLTFFYGSYIYKVFKGKVKIDSMSY